MNCLTTQAKQFHRIQSLDVAGGFLDGMRIDFADGLNCLIGPRGTGKTTILEFVRYALNIFPDDGNGQAIRRRVDDLVKSNLGDGRIRLTIQTKDGLEYIVDRTASGEPLVLTADGQATDITINSGGIFNADIFSQNEIEDIADNPESQLALIDTFVADEINTVQTEIANVQSQLETNALAIIPTQDSLATLENELSTLPSIEERIKALTEVGGRNTDEINQAHTHRAMREREATVVSEADKLLRKYHDWLADGIGRFTTDAKGLFAADILEGPNGKILGQILKRLRDVGGELDRGMQWLVEQLDKQADQLTSDVATLSSAQKTQELAFRDLIIKHKEAQGQATERAKWESVRNSLLAKKRQHEEQTTKIESLKSQRRELTDRLSDLRSKRFDLRMTVAKRITDEAAPLVRVRIEQDGNRERYYSLLVEALKDARVQHKTVARKISSVISPAELVEAVSSGNTDELEKNAGLNGSQAPKVISALAEPKVLLELETIELVDLPKIELQDGDEWKDSLSLSTGQKCTTILPILLLDSKNPLLVDQPEDNLDNRFIYDTVVSSLRRVKTSRQIVLITHNPNIPVLGDAGGVFVLTSDGRQSRLLNSGNVDVCRRHIIDLLEGGEEAFTKRKERYNY